MLRVCLPYQHEACLMTNVDYFCVLFTMLSTENQNLNGFRLGILNLFCNFYALMNENSKTYPRTQTKKVQFSPSPLTDIYFSEIKKLSLKTHKKDPCSVRKCMFSEKGSACSQKKSLLFLEMIF